MEILALCVFARREELRRAWVEKAIQEGVDGYLVDYNFNIEVKDKD